MNDDAQLLRHQLHDAQQQLAITIAQVKVLSDQKSQLWQGLVDVYKHVYENKTDQALALIDATLSTVQHMEAPNATRA